MNLCLIWILYGYSWSCFFKIHCHNAREKLSSCEHLLSDVPGTLRQNLSLHPHFHDIVQSSSWDILHTCWDYLITLWPAIDGNQRYIWLFLGIFVKVNLPAKFCLHSCLNDFFSKKVMTLTHFSSLVQRHWDQWLKVKGKLVTVLEGWPRRLPLR